MPCAICGARFAEHTCVYCKKSVCSGCIDDEARKCIKCKHLRSIPLAVFVRRNLYLFSLIALAWLFMVFPYPFLFGYEYSLHYTVLMPIIIASVAMLIPLVFLFRSWKKSGE
ncbi:MULTISPECIES: hypothetical protein [Candidatus Nitrosocaldus]|jgi:hypothetical protein|uniref:Uncharacterized protein n=1 Tax=Candidatus Nitrosocaldus cavascurensis TaxID=2058097 RepID=A0A2K5AS05_9ARCH|nr:MULTISPECIES: hypothetical protein [Candidatus Nitrosocaldus]SPC34399.1 conserved protein of unknown function [Candidatus Nitrosocaldus cavascurensis]